MKSKAFFIIFKRLSLNQIELRAQLEETLLYLALKLFRGLFLLYIWFVCFYGLLGGGVFNSCQTSKMEVFAKVAIN